MNVVTMAHVTYVYHLILFFFTVFMIDNCFRNLYCSLV